MKKLLFIMLILLLPALFISGCEVKEVEAAIAVKLVDGDSTATGTVANPIETSGDLKLAKDCTDRQHLLVAAGVFFGASVTSASAGDQVLIYDSLTGSGTIITRLKVAANTSTESIMIPGGITCATGLFVAGTDGDTDTVVYYTQ